MAALDRCHNIYDLRKLARRRLPKPIFDYMDGAADDEETLARSTDAFSRYQLVPRTLVDVSKIDTATEVMGQKINWPVFLSPTGMSRLFHHDGELAVARAASEAGTMFSVSTISTYSLEEIAAATERAKLFQIYVQKDRGPLEQMITRCKEAGYGAMCLTVDVPIAGNRERDFYSGMTIPPKLTLMSLLDVMMHPRWSWNYLTSPKFQMANLPTLPPKDASGLNTLASYVSKIFDKSIDWKDAEWMIKAWGGPFAIKGILSVEDARRAADIGASAVMISNHGGRQLDGVPAPIDMLPEIVDAVGDRVEVILDGGIRRGKHVLKALALGATACMVGRAYLFGLGAGGQAGVAKSLGILREEVERGMALLGCRTVAEISSNNIRRAE